MAADSGREGGGLVVAGWGGRGGGGADSGGGGHYSSVQNSTPVTVALVALVTVSTLSAAAPWLGQTHDDTAREKIRAAARDDKTPEKLAKMEAARRDWYTSDDAQKQFRRMSDRAAEQLRTREPETRICDYCGEPFETRARSRKVRFCSIPCKAKARWDSGRDNVERVCAGCGVTFSVNRWHKTKYCSRACANRSRS